MTSPQADAARLNLAGGLRLLEAMSCCHLQSGHGGGADQRVVGCEIRHLHRNDW